MGFSPILQISFIFLFVHVRPDWWKDEHMDWWVQCSVPMTDLLHTLTNLSRVQIAVIIEQQLQLEESSCPIQAVQYKTSLYQFQGQSKFRSSLCRTSADTPDNGSYHWDSGPTSNSYSTYICRTGWTLWESGLFSSNFKQSSTINENQWFSYLIVLILK